MARCPVVNLLRFGNRVARSGFLRPLHAAAGCSSTEPRTGFKPDRVAVVTKTTRYEFELQRYRYAGLSEEDLTQLVRNCSGRVHSRVGYTGTGSYWVILVIVLVNLVRVLVFVVLLDLNGSEHPDLEGKWSFCMFSH